MFIFIPSENVTKPMAWNGLMTQLTQKGMVVSYMVFTINHNAYDILKKTNERKSTENKEFFRSPSP